MILGASPEPRDPRGQSRTLGSLGQATNPEIFRFILNARFWEKEGKGYLATASSWSDGKRPVTHELKWFLAKWAKLMTVVSDFFGLDPIEQPKRWLDSSNFWGRTAPRNCNLSAAQVCATRFYVIASFSCCLVLEERREGVWVCYPWTNSLRVFSRTTLEKCPLKSQVVSWLSSSACR